MENSPFGRTGPIMKNVSELLFVVMSVTQWITF